MIGSIREYFLLSEARATAKLVPEDARVALHGKLALGRQRAEAADALWANGHVAEGLRLAGEAFDATLEAIAPFEDAVHPTGARERELGEAETQLALPEESDAASGDDGDDAANAEAVASANAEASDDRAEASDQAETANAEAGDGANDDEAEAASADGAGVDEAEATKAADEASPAPRVGGVITKGAEISELAERLRRHGLSQPKAREVVETDRALRARALPLLDPDVSASDGELFQALITARRHVDRVLAPASRTPGQLAWTRNSRITFAALIGLACVVGLYFLLRPETGIEATASAEYRAEFAATKAVDGDESTEWLLPDRQEGSLDLQVLPPQHIETLRIKNAKNRGFHDRATRAYTVEVFVDGEVVRTLEAEFPRLDPNPDWVEHVIDVDDVERIRINVVSWHRSGGGLAEVELD